MTGFLDGINDSLKTPNPIETMDENTEVSLDYDKEKLYYNMVGCKADWLYELPQWDNLLDEQTRKDLYKKQKLLELLLRARKSEEMIRAHAEVERNISSAVERMHSF